MSVRNIPLAEAGPLVRDVMLRAPRTVSPETTVRAARAAFENPRERLLLVAGGSRYLGAVTREQLAAADPAGEQTLADVLDTAAPRVLPEAPVADALALLDAEGGDRLPVVAAGGELVGLVCLNRRHGHFCAD